MTDTYVTEAFTPEERALLEPHFSNLEGPVFALTNLPEAVKGAMFARYSRTTKSLRRLFLDEFADDVAGVDIGSVTAASKRAAGIYERVFVEYGDDSVAQLGGVHLACEQSSQLLAKALEWGRLAAYLEQSTRYMRYDDRPGGRWRATVPPELAGTDLAQTYEMFLDDVFAAYGRMYEQLNPWFRTRFPKQPDDTDFVYNQTILAKTCDTLADGAARRHALQPGHLRDRTVLRAAAPAAGPAPAGRDARLRRPDAGRAAQGDPGVPQAGRPARSRRRVERVLARRARAHAGADREARGRRRAGAAWLGQLG